VTAIYDRAALIALPKEMRSKYVDHLQKVLSPAVNILLVTLEFDQETGPPFSVSADEVEALFGERFEIKCLDRVQPDDPRDAGRHEVTWLLQGKGD
jgi:thiopurine S-methyltransferase